MHYLDLLRRLHETLQPESYLEIGVDWGESLLLSRSRTIAIDPAPKPPPASLLGKPGMLLAVCTSDDFFAQYQREALLGAARLDFAFIDGLHQFTQVVRDLEHVERWGHRDTVIAIHDVLPRNAWEATHTFHDGFWAGDVWRIVPFLREHRPNLRCWLTAADPTGMLIVTNLDPAHPGMSEVAEAVDCAFPGPGAEYDQAVEAFIASAAPKPAEEVVRLLTPVRIDAPWQYDTKWGMRLIAERAWRPVLEVAATGDAAGRFDLGMAACLRLINAHWLPAGVREEAYQHLGHYARPLSTLYPDVAVKAPLPSERERGWGEGTRWAKGIPGGAPFAINGDTYLLTNWEPTEILRLDPETGEASRTSLRPAPRLAERFRNTSPGVAVPDGWLFLVNEGEPSEQDRPGFARFVFLRAADFRVTAVSPHFWLTAPGEDTVAGLTLDGEHLLAAFISGDNLIAAAIPLAGVLRGLISLPSPGHSLSAPTGT
ncbi:MAG: class I SAM-dependent methyltransferase [Thermomicrobiales bacterium]